jgi:hypothetical protein
MFKIYYIPLHNWPGFPYLVVGQRQHFCDMLRRSCRGFWLTEVLQETSVPSSVRPAQDPAGGVDTRRVEDRIKAVDVP